MMSDVRPKFQQHSHTYDQATPIQKAVALFLAEQIFDDLPNNHGQNWADIGCGTGKLSQAVLSKFLEKQNLPFSQLFGVDNSQNMLNRWQKNCSISNSEFCRGVSHTPNLKFFQRAYAISPYIKNNLIYPKFIPILADMNQLPFADNAIDVLISSFALHWSTPTVIQELGRVVKNGGFVYLAIPVKGSFSQVQKRFSQLPIYPFLPSDDWKKAINALIKQRHGRGYFFEERQFSYNYPNLTTLLHELKHMGGSVSTQSPIATATLRQYLQDKTPIALDYQVLLVGIAL